MRLLLEPLVLVLELLLVQLALGQSDFTIGVNITGTSWIHERWELISRNFISGEFQSRGSIGNGYVGASVAAAGPFFEIDVNKTDPDGIQPTNGWPLFDDRISFSTISGFYDVEPGFPLPQTNFPELNDNGWESFISGIPHAPGLIFEWDGNALNASVSNTTILNYDRRIRFETGENKWEYTWSPECEGGPSFNVSFETIFSRAIAQVIATKAEITASEDTDLTVTDLLDGRSAVRSYPNAKGMDPENTIYASVHPNGLPNKTAYVVSGLDVSHQCVDASSRRVAQGSYVSLNESTIGQTYNISLKRGETATFYKYVGVASNDKFPDAESVARQKQASAQACGFEVLLEEHKNAWREIMPRSSIDDFSDPATGELPADPNIEVLQIAAVANPYYLLQNLQPDGSNLNDDSISVGGLASDSYAGLIFWDADYWMAPGLNLAFPKWAKQISNFRIKQYPEALKNAANNSYYTFPNDSALYSWTAGRYGNCTGTGPCINYEYHLNYDIANNLLQEYNVTNDETWFNNGPRQIIESIATSTGELLQYNQTTGSYWLHNMTDPDEFANHVDNGAFTIASAAMLLQNANQIRAAQGLPINEAWQIQAENIAFPKSGSGITKEFEAMNNSVVVKQADVVLLAYPLGFDQNYTAEDKLEDLEYYSNRQSPDGPAMTYSVFAADANALYSSGSAAYTFALNSIVPYVRLPFYQFSEQQDDNYNTNGGTNPAFPFLTGHGGANQLVPFGFLGIRTNQPMLYMNPSLPPQIPQLRVRQIYYAGATLQAFMNSTHTTLKRIATPAFVNLVDKYANTTMPIMIENSNSPSEPAKVYNISVNQTITVPNNLYWETTTITGNLIQNLPASSNDSYVPGQFPLAATDGAFATRWQPATNQTTSLTVNMTSIPAQPITGFYGNWGNVPPVSAKIILWNQTADGNVYGAPTTINLGAISASQPYNATAAQSSAQNVEPFVGNDTTVLFEPMYWSGDYAQLVVEGSQLGDGKGATVAEFSLLGKNATET